MTARPGEPSPPPIPPTLLCASSLAGVEEHLSELGSVITLPEQEITPDMVRGVDALFTRSKVQVNRELLEGSPVRFYGTATAGVDHVDTAWLEAHGIAWTSAAGGNANSVAEYVVAGLLWLAADRPLELHGKTLGILGAGHVGSSLARLAPALGLHVLLNDPPLAEASGDPVYLPLARVLAESDIVSMHVPLTDDGPWPTRTLVDAPFLHAMKPGAVFINAARGEIVDESALKAARRSGQIAAMILDVFNREPDIDASLVDLADLATPHIAGYSYDGRLEGTRLIANAYRRYLGKPVGPWVKKESCSRLNLPAMASPAPLLHRLHAAVRGAYDIAEDSAFLKPAPGPSGADLAARFQHRRKTYPRRREFHHYSVVSDREFPHPLIEPLAALGFSVT